MMPAALPFACELSGDLATIAITGEVDHAAIAAMVQKAASARRIVIDISRARGACSTVMAGCIQLAIACGGRVQVRGASRRFEATVQQMHLQHLIAVLADPAGASAGGGCQQVG